HARRDGRLVDAALRYSVLDQFAHRVDYLGPASVIETNVEEAVLVIRRACHGLVDARAHARRELVASPADEDAHSALVHLVDLALHRLVEQAHERAHLRAGPRPVLGRERVDRQRVHTEGLAGLEHAFDRAHAGAVAEAGRVAAAAGPAAVAVHDDSDVAGDLGVQG